MINEKAIPFDQLTLLSPRYELEKALMSHQQTKRLNYNFWGYDLLSPVAANAPGPRKPWEGKLKVTWWRSFVCNEYSIHQSAQDLENEINQDILKEIGQKNPRLLFKNGESIYFNSYTEMSDDDLKSIMNVYYKSEFKHVLTSAAQKFPVRSAFFTEEAFDKLAVRIIDISEADLDQEITSFFDKQTKKGEKEDSAQLIKIIDTVKKNRLLCREKMAEITLTDRAALLDKLNEVMTRENIARGWTTEYVIKKIESPYIKIFWTGVLLLFDLTMYNTIDQLHMGLPNEIHAIIQLALSTLLTMYYFSTWYESYQLAQYKRHNLNKTGLDATRDTDAIREESHVVAVQVGLLSICANILMNKDIWNLPNADLLLGGIASVVVGVAMIGATYGLNRYYAQKNKFTAKQYAAVMLLALGAGVCFSMSTLLPNVEKMQIEAETLVLNSERVLLLMFGAGLSFISTTASVAWKDPDLTFSVQGTYPFNKLYKPS